MLLSTHIHDAETLDAALLRVLRMQLGYRGPEDKAAILAWLGANPDLDSILASREGLLDLPAAHSHQPVFDLRERRSEQSEFRRRVLEKWSYRCAITGAKEAAVLDAAHLPGKIWQIGENDADDGICLRADLHRLLDAGKLILVEAPSGWIVRTDALGYQEFNGRTVLDPSRGSVQ